MSKPLVPESTVLADHGVLPNAPHTDADRWADNADLELPKTHGRRHYDPSVQNADYQFLLHDVLKVDTLQGKVKGYEDISANDAQLVRFDGMATAAHDVSHQGDRDPVRMKTISDTPGQEQIETFLPPHVKALHDRYAEEEWTAMATSNEHGGLGIPHAYAGAIGEKMMSANPGYGVLEMLSHGVAKAIEAKGSDELKQQWLPRINSGKFTGAMVMTEPEQGSSLTDVTTTIQLDKDGKVGKVTGYKSFLSSADHDATLGPQGERNITHMVLARTKDADGEYLLDNRGRPKLSLVLVPRVLLDADGHYVDEDGRQVDTPNSNHVRATKLNDKMGLEVQSNTDAAYDGSKGWIVGDVGDGLKNMFVIMDEARLAVGLQGVGIAETVRQNMERFAAEERKQGPAGHIINYPDVQDKILKLRAHTEAGRAIAAEVGLAFDEALHADESHMTAQQKQEQQRYVGVMTPLVKWGLTEKCDHAINEGIQAMGGRGYMREWGMSQAFIDSRIARIYEGSNPVLAVALTTHKLKHMDAFLKKARAEVKLLAKDASISDITQPVDEALHRFEDATQWMQATGLSAKKHESMQQQFQAASGYYMELMYQVAAGIALAKNAHVASEKLSEGADIGQQDGFYESKIATARYFANAVIAPEGPMYDHKMRHNCKYLELPDHNIDSTEPTLFAAGARAATQFTVGASDVIDSLRRDSHHEHRVR